MAKGIALKCDRNTILELKLYRLNGKLYEATTDLYYICGLTFAQNSKIKRGQDLDQNKLGLAIEEYNEIKKIVME